MLPGYTNGACMTQAISNLPFGISVSKRVMVDQVDRVEATAAEMKDLALANDSGISLFAGVGMVCYTCYQDIRGLLCGWGSGASTSTRKVLEWQSGCARRTRMALLLLAHPHLGQEPLMMGAWRSAKGGRYCLSARNLISLVFIGLVVWDIL